MRSIHRSFWRKMGAEPKKIFTAEQAFLKNFVPGCSMMFTRRVAGGVLRVKTDISFLHDHLALVIASGLGRVVFTGKPLVRYRQHEGNAVGAKFSQKSFDRDKFISDLERNIRRLHEAGISGYCENFCRVYLSGTLAERVAYADWFFYLRNNLFKDHVLALAECLIPKFNTYLRRVL